MFQKTMPQLRKLGNLMRLLLVLAIFATAIAWFPQNALAATGPASAAEQLNAVPVKVTAVLVNRTIVIKATNLPRSRTFFVRVKERVNDSWQKIGKGRSNKQGRLELTLDLPARLYNKNQLRMCLKDTITNKTYCTIARRAY